MADDDPLSRTATAPPSARPPDDLIGTTIGRYRVEREVGAGGMGVVYVAVDPDLERRIAIKVLRATSADAARRLQREAKAMARLAHPNVVTVYEVGSAGGRDYVAMELFEGESLAEWLRAEPRAPAAILDAFLAAGRGLAAAHAAGIVHRDFKPHNVLRGKGGRIAVTDFGLAREAALESDALAVTQPLTGGAAVATMTPGTLAELTATGAVLGTPAYMAPEQWRAAAVSPATDQFAFCVALWEALAGERPFRGKTVEELRTQVEAGPATLDAARVPRHLRAPLLRGLAPDPADRWPSMDALLAQLAPRRSRRAVFGAIGAGAGVAAALAALALTRGGAAPSAPPCPAPALDVDALWSPAVAQAVAAGKQAETGRFIERDLRAWRDARAQACAGEPVARAAQVACLDGVLARTAAVVRALPALATSPYVDAGGHLLDPAVCLQLAPPRLTASSPAYAEVVAASLAPTWNDPAVRASLATRVASDPCALALVEQDDAGAGDPKGDQALEAARQATEACGDDRLRAKLALVELTRQMGRFGASIDTAAQQKRTEAAIARVAQPDLLAALDRFAVGMAMRDDDDDRALAADEQAASRMAARGRFAAELGIRVEMARLRLRRGGDADLAANAAMFAAWEPQASARLGDDAEVVRELQRTIAMTELLAGKLDEGAARLARVREHSPPAKPVSLRGKVVDERGAPVGGAHVIVGNGLIGTAAAAGMLLDDDGSWRDATTASDGTFAIADAPEGGAVIAELGERRSAPVRVATDVALALGPTSRIEGTVDLHGKHVGSVFAIAVPGGFDTNHGYQMIAPVRTDGSFAFAGVPRGKVLMQVVQQRVTTGMATAKLDVREPVVTDVRLELPVASRTIVLVVRSTIEAPVGNAQVFVVPGAQRSTNALEFMRGVKTLTQSFARAADPQRFPALEGVLHRGDLVAELAAPATGGTACAVGLPASFGDVDLIHKVRASPEKIEVRCAPIPDDEPYVVVEVPPVPRLD